MKTPGYFGYRALVLAGFFSFSLIVQAADPAPEAKEVKPLPPIPMPIVPTRFVIPDEIPSPPNTADVKPSSENKTVLMSPATLNRIFKESEAAFEDKDYDKAAALTQQLLENLQSYPGGAPERIYFNLGLANLLGGKLPEAEAAFKECIKRHPNGTDISRAYIGLGKSCMLQNTAKKKAEAIAAFKLAASDPTQKNQAEMLIKEVSTDAPSLVDPSDRK
jgi:TolA-binding protein